MNFSKFMIMNYGEKNIKGSYECSKVKGEFSNPTYQKYYLQKYSSKKRQGKRQRKGKRKRPNPKKHSNLPLLLCRRGPM